MFNIDKITQNREKFIDHSFKARQSWTGLRFFNSSLPFFYLSLTFSSSEHKTFSRSVTQSYCCVWGHPAHVTPWFSKTEFFFDIISSSIHMACPSHFILATFIISAIQGSLKDSVIKNYLICQTPSSTRPPHSWSSYRNLWEKPNDEVNKNVMLEEDSIFVHWPVFCVPK